MKLKLQTFVIFLCNYKDYLCNYKLFGFVKLATDRYNYSVKIINDIAVVMRTFPCQLAAIKVSLVHPSADCVVAT